MRAPKFLQAIPLLFTPAIANSTIDVDKAAQLEFSGGQKPTASQVDDPSNGREGYPPEATTSAAKRPIRRPGLEIDSSLLERPENEFVNFKKKKPSKEIGPDSQLTPDEFREVQEKVEEDYRNKRNKYIADAVQELYDEKFLPENEVEKFSLKSWLIKVDSLGLVKKEGEIVKDFAEQFFNSVIAMRQREMLTDQELRSLIFKDPPGKGLADTINVLNRFISAIEEKWAEERLSNKGITLNSLLNNPEHTSLLERIIEEVGPDIKDKIGITPK